MLLSIEMKFAAPIIAGEVQVEMSFEIPCQLQTEVLRQLLTI